MAVEWDTSQAIAGLDALKQRVMAAAERAIVQGAQVMVETTKGTAPVLTGRLRASIYSFDKRREGYTWIINVAPHAIYARQRELGGPITAKGPYMLRNRETGEVFGHEVSQEGSHYFSHGVEAATPRIADAFRQAMADAFGG